MVSNRDGLILILLMMLLLPEHLLLLVHYLLRIFGRHDLGEVEGTSTLAECIDPVHPLVVEGSLSVLHGTAHWQACLIELHLLDLLYLLIDHLLIHMLEGLI